MRWSGEFFRLPRVLSNIDVLNILIALNFQQFSNREGSRFKILIKKVETFFPKLFELEIFFNSFRVGLAINQRTQTVDSALGVLEEERKVNKKSFVSTYIVGV